VEGPITQLTRIGHVELRVRDLDRSAGFYCEVLGMFRSAATPPSDRVCLCVGVPASGGEPFSIVLAQGLPPSTELAGLDHVSLSALTEQDVRDIYARAGALGYRCTAPRYFDGAYQAFVFDPDGYKVEVAARSSRHGEMGQNNRRAAQAAVAPAESGVPAQVANALAVSPKHRGASDRSGAGDHYERPPRT
jgi:catechol 2,3-dioxygenase-like lactoylglutathione lyase family enzyme